MAWSTLAPGRRALQVRLTMPLLAACVAACGAPTPAEPTPPQPIGNPIVVLTGQTVDAVSDQPVSGVSVQISGFNAVTSAADGGFALVAVPSAERALAATVVSPETVDRVTRVRLPGPHARLALIPKSFDLVAFDQMYRGDGVLRRWINAPALVVQQRVMTFTNTDDVQYVAGAAMVPDADVPRIIDDLMWALPQLTGGTFTAFAQQHVETAAEGEMVTVRRIGSIVVGRYEGLQTATGSIAYGRWSWTGAGEVVAGIIMLDNAFEIRSSATTRRAVRVHELGHALGWRHVDVRPSIMNPSPILAPNEFDRTGSTIAFLRPLLNQSPDRDTTVATLNHVNRHDLFSAGDQ